MSVESEGFVFSMDKNLLSIERICELLATTYWAKNREKNRIDISIKNSICYGVYKDGYQVGFARVVTDYATVFWIADVVIDKEYRHRGLGKKLVEFITGSEYLSGMKGILRTTDAHGLYERYGFVKDSDKFMIKEE